MTDRETVIRGLECCVKDMGECEFCPYDQGRGKCGCGKQLYADALALLKAQEPRVMTLEEVKSLKRDAVVWFEYNGVNKQRPRIVDRVYDSGIIFTDGGYWQFNADAYGKKFRLWTSRPTDAQREATPWES